MIFPDIFSIGTLKIMTEISDVLGKKVPILGEGSSDFWDWPTNRQFYQTEVLQDSTPVLMFSGPLIYNVNMGSGWATSSLIRVAPPQFLAWVLSCLRFRPLTFLP